MGAGVPGLISSIQAYGGLQAWAARAHRPSQSLGRLGTLEVRLAQTNGHLTFEVSNDGVGVDSGRTSHGTGLRGMADRV